MGRKQPEEGTLGELLFRLRESAGLGAGDAAELHGMDRTFLYMIEVGRRRPSPATLATMLVGYGADAETTSEAWRRLAAAPSARRAREATHPTEAA